MATTMRKRGPGITRLHLSALAVGMAALTASQLQAQDPRADSRQLYEDMRLFSQVLNQIRVNHPDTLDTHVLLMAAIEGMVRFADPHSYVLPAWRLSPDKLRAAEERKLSPVPIAFAYLGDTPVVISTAPGTKAAELGILPGDELILIDGEPVLAESENELELLLSGNRGSKVGLTFLRRQADGSVVWLSWMVERERPEEMSAVGTSLMLDSVTGYIRLLHFGNEETSADLQAALVALQQAGARALVLDLRDNSGGLVRQAAQVAGEFLPRGALLYTAYGRKDEVNDTVLVEGGASDENLGLPMVVLVNHGTASAAELLAGALQDHDRALIVGHPTFGKSMLMTEFPMTDGSRIALVVGYLRTPCGRSVQRPYRTVRTQDYFRFAGMLRDTTNLPSCRTVGGRSVYGGGGIYPDVLLDRPGWPPRWQADIQERGILLRWVGQHLDTGGEERPSVDYLGQSRDNSDWRASFMDLAASEGVALPPDVDHERLYELLVRALARGMFGSSGFYHVVAMRDAEVAAAVLALGRVRAR